MIKKTILIFLLLLLPSVSWATIYYQDTCESYTLDAQATNPPWCNTACGGTTCAGYFKGAVPVQGSKYLNFDIPDSTSSCYYEVGNNQQSLPITSLSGRTIYIAYLKRFERIGGNDIWQDGTNCNSGDKGIEVRGTGVRWVVGRGCGWAGGYTTDHHWTVWLGNPSYHLNRDNAYCPEIEGEGTSDSDSIQLNQGGYSQSNPYNLEYEKWYSIVFMMTFNTMNGSNPNPNGATKLWVNGVLLADRSNMCLTASTSATIDIFEIGGTIAQGTGGLAPAHKRQFDAFIYTDNIDDIDASAAFNYFADPEAGGDTTDPVVTIATTDPSNIVFNTLSISGTASDAVGVTSCKYRIGSAPDGSNGTVITGTTSWSGTATGFSVGANTLYVGCTDAAANWGSDSITVNYNPPPAKGVGLIISGGRLQ